MSKKGKIADPHAAREAERYDNPIPSREAIIQLLTEAEQPLKHGQICRELGLEEEDAVDALIGLLKRQKRATAGMLPHRHRVIVEHAIDPAAQGSRGMVVVHTLWGSAVNRPLSMAIQAAWQEKHGFAVCPTHILQHRGGLGVHADMIERRGTGHAHHIGLARKDEYLKGLLASLGLRTERLSNGTSRGDEGEKYKYRITSGDHL